jgi:hypothetical protein
VTSGRSRLSSLSPGDELLSPLPGGELLSPSPGGELLSPSPGDELIALNGAPLRNGELILVTVRDFHLPPCCRRVNGGGRAFRTCSRRRLACCGAIFQPSKCLCNPSLQIQFTQFALVTNFIHFPGPFVIRLQTHNIFTLLFGQRFAIVPVGEVVYGGGFQ